MRGAPRSEVLDRIGGPDTYDIGLWKAIAGDLGCAGLLVPEELDGAGASFREVAAVAEELGRAVAPVPFVGSAVVATTALLTAGDDAALPELARGDVTAALAVGFESGPGAAFPLTVRVSGPRPSDARTGLTRLRGSVRGVADALPASLLIVPADGVPHALYVVGAGAEGVRRTPVVSLDMTRQLCDIEFEDAPARVIASGGQADRAVQAALSAGAAAVASEQLGVAERCLDMTVAYVKERRQFARPVGSFQGLKHRLADLWVGDDPGPGRGPVRGRLPGRRGTPTRRSPSRWPSPTAATSPSGPPRSACRCTAASGSPGSTRRTCTSSAPRPSRSRSARPTRTGPSLARLADLPGA